MTSDQRIEFIIGSAAALVAQLTELKTLQEQLRQARKAMMYQTLASGSVEEIETAEYH
jgi:hypothetical protein